MRVKMDYVCDRCGAVIGKTNHSATERWILQMKSDTCRPPTGRWDLCGACAKAIDKNWAVSTPLVAALDDEL